MKNEVEMTELNKGLLKSVEPSSGQGETTTSDEHIVPADDHLNRPSFKGAYRPVRDGTIRGSTFAMLASALGTGCLNLPIRVHKLGVGMFLIVLLICCLLSYWGMYMMERIIVKFKVISYS